MFMRMRFGTARGQPADEWDHLDGFSVSVGEPRQGLGDDEFTAKLLAQFTDDCGLGGFAGFDLAAGELPLEWQVLVRRPLGHQDQSRPLYEGAHNRDGRQDGIRGHVWNHPNLRWPRGAGQLHIEHMSEEDPVIELEPKNPFSWKIVAMFLVAWLVVFGLMYELKSGMIRLLLPLIAIIFLVYLVICTLYLIKNRK